jgi:hypothetical protein
MAALLEWQKIISEAIGRSRIEVNFDPAALRSSKLGCTEILSVQERIRLIAEQSRNSA